MKMEFNFGNEIAKYVLQLLVLGVLGGGVTWFYTRLQKNKELRLRVLREFALLHGKFIALRYEFNSFHVQHHGKRSPKFHPLKEDEIRVERWKYFQQACRLIGEFQSMKSLIVETFPETADNIHFLFSKYQDWRRLIQANKPILQSLDGRNKKSYNELRERYNQIIRQMRKKI